MAATTYQDLANLVDQNGHVLTVEMGLLRDIHGAGKLGSIVVSAIHDRLESLGLGHTPRELPTYQWERAIVYRKGTPVARVVDAINSRDENSDTVLREFAGKNNNKANEIVQRIKELVCD